MKSKITTHRHPQNYLTIVLMLCVVFFIYFSLAFSAPKSEPKVKNVILAISDGFGPASQTFARNYAEHLNKEGYGFQLPLDTVLLGTSRTRSSSSLVTDSAAGATAFSCGLKSYNGAIGVDPEGKPCETVLELSKKQGLFTGLVATSRVTHGTKKLIQQLQQLLEPMF